MSDDNQNQLRPAASRSSDLLACPTCGGEFLKAIYMGMPLRICVDPACGCAKGQPAIWLMEHIPLLSKRENEEGGWAFYIYDGSYWKALWNYLFGK